MKRKNDGETWELVIEVTVNKPVGTMQTFVNQRLYETPTYPKVKLKKYKLIKG